MLLLAGDIGGTKTSLAVFSSEAGPRAPLTEITFTSADYSSLEELVRAFLTQVPWKVDGASFGVAGPVVSGRAKITNLPWAIDEAHLRKALKLPSVRLLNDLAAIAHAVPILEPGDLHTLNPGRSEPRGTRAVIAPGTGLGEAFLAWEGSRYRAYASEGGHVDFAPTDALELELLRYLLERYEHVSYERVCSGIGIPNIYSFLNQSGRAKEPAWLKEQLASAPDATPIIVDAALDEKRPCAICTETLNVFIRILGAAAGNLALSVLATGGIYLGGGIPPRILPLLRNERFLQAFTSKGRMSKLLARVPVQVILNPKSALLGAACHGLEVSHDA
jgi:glucokinase